MGWGAAQALAAELGVPFDENDAYEMLYGHKDGRPAKRFRCRICKKKFRSDPARLQHQRDVHFKANKTE